MAGPGIQAQAWLIIRTGNIVSGNELRIDGWPSGAEAVSSVIVT
jgi:hypothetical protein